MEPTTHKHPSWQVRMDTTSARARVRHKACPRPCGLHAKPDRQVRGRGGRQRLNDSWIAATAIAYGIPVITQDADYGAMPDVQVIKIRRSFGAQGI